MARKFGADTVVPFGFEELPQDGLRAGSCGEDTREFEPLRRFDRLPALARFLDRSFSCCRSQKQRCRFSHSLRRVAELLEYKVEEDSTDHAKARQSSEAIGPSI